MDDDRVEGRNSSELTTTMGTGLVGEDEPHVRAVLLVVLVGPDAGHRYRVGEELIIGRDADVQVSLRDDGISRRHSRIRRSESGDYVIEDLGSRNGTYINGSRVGTAFLRSGDKIAIGTGTILLFTNHDRYEEQVLQAQKLHILGQLAGGIVHDFNNLIVTILGNVTYLRETPPAAEELGECLGEIETAARRAAELTAQLVSFARPQHQNRELLEVDRLIHEVTGLLRRTVPRSVEILTAVAPELRVLGDSSQLLQVLMNACMNAKYAMAEGGGQLRITAQTREVTHRPTMVEIAVEDTGVGMDEATRQRAFQPFFTTKPRSEGTGLGLATAYRIVRSHGGDISLSSEPGAGTRLVVTLPAATEGRLRETGATTRPPARLSGRALVVDDEPLVRSTTKRMLERLGLTVAAASDGVEALEIYRQASGDFDLVIMDLDMPNMGGEEAIGELRREDSNLAVIVASGHADTTRSERLRIKHNVTILPKPFDATSLRHHVEVALRQP